MHSNWIFGIAAIALALGVASCGSSGADAPSCERTVDHFIQVAGDGDRATFVKECEAMNLSSRQARCIMAAETVADFAACDLPAHPRAAALEK